MTDAGTRFKVKPVAPANGRDSARAPVDLDAYLTETVYPALFDRLDAAFPEFGWQKHGDAWEATRWPSGFEPQVEHKHADRLMVYRDRPWWIKVHGHSGVRWIDYINGGKRPRGKAFLDAVRKLCELAGVPYPVREKELTPEEQERARKREALRAAKEDATAFCQEVLFSDRGEQARAYLRDRRGLTDDEVRELRLGLYVSAKELGAHLKARGHGRQDCLDAGVLWRRLEGFVVVPWADEHGRALTLYGRWPAKKPPLMNELEAWARKRGELWEAWKKAADGKPWQEPPIPKTIAIPGKDSKASPFCFDRARRAGHDEVVLLEGVFDALLLQARGDRRAVASVAAQLSGEQLKTLARCRVRRVYVCGDPDGGGDRGTLANVEALTRAGIEAFVVPRLPDDTDPDEFLLARGIDAWRDWVGRAEHHLRYRVRLVVERWRPVSGDWNDVAREDALRAAFGVASALPAERGDELDRYFWPDLAAGVGGKEETIRRRFLAYQAREQGKGQGNRHEANGVPPQVRPAFALDLIDSRTFATSAYRLRWLVNGVLVDGQPGILGGPKKGVKTGLAVELAVSYASGQSFLGEFAVPHPGRVCVISGESGEATLQSLARRVAASKGLRLEDLDIFWGFKLPQVCDFEHMAALQDALARHEIRLLLFDPLYLALLSGLDGSVASNLYTMGPLLLSLARACLDVGCTPVLVHHFRITRANPYGEPQLEDLAFAGVQEFARQWVLLGRRSPFDPEHPEGKHELWLAVGGSAGHSLLRAVDVFEGRLGPDFGGRTWRVEVHPAAEARTVKADEREQEQQRRREKRDRDDEAVVLAVLDRLDPGRKGVTPRKVRGEAHRSSDRVRDALGRLVEDGVVEPLDGTATCGNGARIKATLYRRPPLNGEHRDSG